MSDIEVKMDFHTDELLKDLEERKEKVLTMLGLQAEGYAKIEIESSPRRVDTGRLRNSITWATLKEHSSPEYTSNDDADAVNADDGVTESQAEKDAVIIGTNVEYAYEVHEGNPEKKMTPNRFLRNAVEKYADEYKRIIDDELKHD